MDNNGIVVRDDQTGFNWSRIPIMTIEMGFLSNPHEEALLATDAYQKELALALYKGIDAIFKPK
jgi:N-acetylmuramoyl-L-alanine amidase